MRDGFSVVDRGQTVMRAGSLAAVLSFIVLGLGALAADQAFIAPINATSHVFFGLQAAQAGRVDLLYTSLGAIIHIIASFFWAGVALFLASMINANHTITAWLAGLVTAAIAMTIDYVLLPARLSPGWELVLDVRGVAAGFLALGIGWSLGLALSPQAARTARPMAKPFHGKQVRKENADDRLP